MHPLQNGTQVPDMPDTPNPIGDAGYMTEKGNPSVPGAHYFNAQIKEFENLLAAAGVTFDRTKFDHLAKVLTANGTQFAPYRADRIYKTGEICCTETNGEISFWQWYSNVESLAGKSPLLEANRHVGWSDNSKPFYWVPYTGEQVGMPFYWLDTSAPEWAVMEINVDLPIAVYWRLARRYPHLVSGEIINTGEIRAEFLRVLDQGRGLDPNRQLNSHQNGSIIALNDSNDSQVFSGQKANEGQLADNALSFDTTNISDRTALTSESIRYYAGASTAGLGLAHIPSHSGVARPTNVARPMAIAI